MMDEIFKTERAQKWLKIYMDDILVGGKKGNLPELIERGRRVLQTLEQNDLSIKPDKSYFFVEKVDFFRFHNS